MPTFTIDNYTSALGTDLIGLLTPIRYDVSTKAATTAFVKSAGMQVYVTNPSGATPITLTSTDAGSEFWNSGTSTYNLPALSTGQNGDTYTFYNHAANGSATPLTVTSPDALKIYGGGGSGVTSVNVGVGDSLTLANSNNTYWVQVAGAASVGRGQTWQAFTVGTQRIAGTTYTNSTGKPIQISAWVSAGNSANFTLTIAGVVVATPGNANTNNTSGISLQVSGIVPAGATYVITVSGATINGWSELR